MFPCSLIFLSGNFLFCNLVFTLTLPIYLPKVTKDYLTLHYPFLSLILRYHIAYRFLTWPGLTWPEKGPEKSRKKGIATTLCCHNFKLNLKGIKLFYTKPNLTLTIVLYRNNQTSIRILKEVAFQTTGRSKRNMHDFQTSFKLDRKNDNKNPFRF